MAGSGLKRYKTAFQVRYAPFFGVFQRLMPAAEKLAKDFPSWETDGVVVYLSDPGRRCSVKLEPDSSFFEQDSDDLGVEKRVCGSLNKAVKEDLKVESFLRIGYRQKSLVPVKMTFESLVKILDLKFLSQDEQFRQIMPPITDLMHRVDCFEDGTNYHITVGPVRGHEVPRFVGFNRERHLDKKTALTDYGAIAREYPETAVALILA